jgi:hypothetical protein
MESVHGTVAGLDVHKKTVVVVVLQSDHSDEDHAAGVFGTTRYGLNELIAFLRQHGVTQRGDGINGPVLAACVDGT